MEQQPFVLAELEDLSPIFAPLKSTTRIKYTCFNVSNNFLMFGATSGGVYVFRREPCVFLQLLPNKEGSIAQLAVSPDEKLVAYATVRGLVSVLERSPSHAARHLVSSSEHLDARVTALAWGRGGAELYVADDAGRVSILTVAVRNMFQSPSFVLMQLDSRVVQMDLQAELLLVSTLTKCYVCDTSKEMFRQIGHKPRDGEYGACIVGAGSEAKFFCARPGSRVWEVSADGTVMSTHHFKQALATPPSPIIFQAATQPTGPPRANHNHPEQSFNFSRLHLVLSRFLFTFKRDGVYIFDPEKAAVVLWNDQLADISDAKCVSDVIYVWLATGKMVALNLVLLEKFLIRLYFRKKYTTLAKLCLDYCEYLKGTASESSKLHLLSDLDVKLREGGGPGGAGGGSEAEVTALCDGLAPLLALLKASAQQRKVQNAQRLQSGIFLIGSEAQLEDYSTNKAFRPSFLNLKGRSHSASPERIKSQGSTSSLPDLSHKEGGRMEEEEDGTPSHPTRPFVEQRPEGQGPTPGQLEGLARVCGQLEATHEPSNALTFELLDCVLGMAVPPPRNPAALALVARPVPLYTHLPDGLVKLAAEVFHSALRSRLVLDWLADFEAASDAHPAFLAEHCDPAALRLDFKLSKMLRLFGDILDESQVVDLMKEVSPECYYLSLVEVTERFQDCSLSSVADSNLSLSNIASRVKTLNIAYFLVKVGQIDKCARYAARLDLLDLLYLVLKFEASLVRSGRSAAAAQLQCHTVLLSFLDKAELGAGPWPALLDAFALLCLERVNASASCASQGHCPCGFPLPASPSLHPGVTMFSEVGVALLERWAEAPAKRLQACCRVPQLWRHLLALRRREPLLSTLPLILQLGDMEELELRLPELDAMLLEVALRHLLGLKNGNCLNCGARLAARPAVSLTALGMLCVKALGPRPTAELFSKYGSDMASRDMEQCLFQAVLFSAIMEKHSRGLRQNVVELLRSDRGPGTPCEESQGQAWGVRLDRTAPCGSCRLPLDSEVLVSDGGLLVFKCSHAYHSVCLNRADPTCPLCSK